jgi:hypothetical protein
MYYFVPGKQAEDGTQLPGITWDTVNDRHMTAKNDVDAIDQIKEFENLKRIPPTWKIFLEKTSGEFLEVNRRSISRKRIEAKRVSKSN